MPRRLILHIGYYKTGYDGAPGSASPPPSGARRARRAVSGGRPTASAQPEPQRLAVPGAPSSPVAPAVLVHEQQRVRRLQELEGPAGPRGDGSPRSRPPPLTRSSSAPRSSSASGATRACPPSRRRTCIHALGVDHVTIVCYVRRPDRYLESWYNQLVKMGLPVARLSLSDDARARPASPVLRHPAHRLRSHDRVLGPPGRLRRAHRARLRPPPQRCDLRRLQRRRRSAVGRRRRASLRSGRTAGSTTTSSSTPGSGRCSSPRENHGALHRLLEQMAEEPRLPRRFDVYVLSARARRVSTRTSRP